MLSASPVLLPFVWPERSPSLSYLESPPALARHTAGGPQLPWGLRADHLIHHPHHNGVSKARDLNAAVQPLTTKGQKVRIYPCLPRQAKRRLLCIPQNPRPTAISDTFLLKASVLRADIQTTTLTQSAQPTAHGSFLGRDTGLLESESQELERNFPQKSLEMGNGRRYPACAPGRSPTLPSPQPQPSLGLQLRLACPPSGIPLCQTCDHTGWWVQDLTGAALGSPLGSHREFLQRGRDRKWLRIGRGSLSAGCLGPWSLCTRRARPCSLSFPINKGGGGAPPYEIEVSGPRTRDLAVFSVLC